jgi:ADP-ribose pyrophosphatase YjhB (NUDIX family)
MARTDYYNDPDAPPPNSVVPSTTAVVTDELDRIVLVRRRDNDLWALPGGGMELGESIVDTAVREVKEEPGSMSKLPASSGCIPTRTT